MSLLAMMPFVSPDALMEQLAKSSVPFKKPSDPDWATYSTTFNTRLPVAPVVVVLPTTVEHICDAVRCANQQGFKVQARSGGHSYASYSNGGMDGAMIVDLRKLQFIRCDDKCDGVVTVQPGVRLGNLARAIYDQDKRALSHGTCAAVGIGGHFTHGGYGFFSRAWGLAMDQIVGLDVVTADGSHLPANAYQNPDHLTSIKAMRGAADSFGIITTFYLQTQPAPPSVIYWDIKMSKVTNSVESAVTAFQHIENFAHNVSVMDRHLGFNVSLSSDNFAIGGTYLGSLDNFENRIMPALLEGISVVTTIDIKQVDWLTALKHLNEDQDLEVEQDYSGHSNFFAKSVVVPEPGFTEEGLTCFFEHLLDKGKDAPVSYFILMDFYGGVDSQINQKDLNFSAFAHRDALWVSQLYGYVGENQVFPPEGLDFINGLSNAMTAHLPEYGAYTNYTDPSLTREDAHRLYYGARVLRILKVQKSKWDPNNVFFNPQSI